MQGLVLHLQTQLGRGQGTGRPALEMGRLRDDIKRLEADSRKLSEGMSGQLQVTIIPTCACPAVRFFST